MINLLRCKFNFKFNLIDELPVEKRHLSKLIIICRTLNSKHC